METRSDTGLETSEIFANSGLKELASLVSFQTTICTTHFLMESVFDPTTIHKLLALLYSSALVFLEHESIGKM